MQQDAVVVDEGDVVKQVLYVVYLMGGDDDDLLIAEVYRFLGVSTESFADVMATRKRRGLPSFESIRRTRQKLQETEPSLRPGEEVQQIRKKEEVKYYDYAKGYNDSLA